MNRRILLVVVGVLVLSACRLDVTVDVVMEPDGTGVVTVDVVADAALMEQVPDLVDDLRLEDAEANGWVVAGPTEAADGSVSLRLTHDFFTNEELATVLNSIGPPLERMGAARTYDPETEQTTNAINGEMVLRNGYESFADADLIAAVGGLPFEEEIAASGLAPAEAMSFTYRTSLPGELVSADGTEVGDGVIEWEAALDGTSQGLLVQTVQRPEGSGNSWAGPLSTAAFIALIVWLVLSLAFIAMVAFARNARRRRRNQALRNID